MEEQRLAEIRENFNLTQREMAIKLGIGKSTYARWETMEQIIPLERLNTFCNIFNVSMDYTLKLSKDNIKYKNLNKLDKKIIGNRLKTIRKKLNLTQELIADFWNTTQSTISSYESGNTMILTIFAINLCKKYNLSLDWLCGRK